MLGGKGACILRHWLKDVARVASAKHYSTSGPQLGGRRIRAMSENTHSSERTDCLASSVLATVFRASSRLTNSNRLAYSHYDACSTRGAGLAGRDWEKTFKLDHYSSGVGKGAIQAGTISRNGAERNGTELGANIRNGTYME